LVRRQIAGGVGFAARCALRPAQFREGAKGAIAKAEAYVLVWTASHLARDATASLLRLG